ncbi:hypothetical protein J6590_052356 [Homalodisca vitripennis]|nr:hypothetical protein J6590_052356 [Homalodisca vitripennis]
MVTPNMTPRSQNHPCSKCGRIYPQDISCNGVVAATADRLQIALLSVPVHYVPVRVRGDWGKDCSKKASNWTVLSLIDNRPLAEYRSNMLFAYAGYSLRWRESYRSNYPHKSSNLKT